MRVAIATSDEQEEGYEDIDLLVKALHQNNATGELVIWDDPEIDWISYDIVFIDSTWNYTDKPEAFINWCKLTSTVSKLVNPFEIIQLSSSKRYLLTLEAAGLNTPPTHILNAASSITQDVLDTYRDKIVIKPLVGAGGLNTFMLDSLQTAVQTPEFNNLLAKEAVLVQGYVSEIETLGELSAIFIAGQLSHCVLKRPATNDFRVQHQYGGTTILAEAPEYVHDLYEKILSVLNVNPVYMRLDFIPTDNPTIMEVEMVEPNKYLSLYPKSAELLATAIVS